MSINKLTSEASLKEIADKLEELSVQDFSAIDIVVKKELPTTVKNGQIVVITDKEPNNILFSFSEPSSMNENDLYVRMYTKDQELFRVGTGKKTIEFCLFGVKQFVNGAFVGAKSYIGVNSQWKSMNEKYYIKDDIVLNSSDFKTNSSFTTNHYIKVENNVVKIFTNVYGTYQYNETFYTDYLVDLTSYSKLGVKFKSLVAEDRPLYDKKLKFGVLSEDLNTVAYTTVLNEDICNSPNREMVVELDISELNGDHRLMVGMITMHGTINIHVTELYLK